MRRRSIAAGGAQLKLKKTARVGYAADRRHRRAGSVFSVVHEYETPAPKRRGSHAGRLLSRDLDYCTARAALMRP